MAGRGFDEYGNDSFEEAIWKNPDALIASPIKMKSEKMVYNFAKKQIIPKVVEIAPADEKIYKEILSNATDNGALTVMRTNTDENGELIEGTWKVPKIGEIDITMTDTTITVRNGGMPIPIGPSKNTTKDNLVLVPQMIFGSGFSGSNTDKSKLQMSCGKNGVGAKGCNALSSSFIVKCGDNINGHYFECEWVEHMTKIKNISCEPPYEKKGGKWVSTANKKNRYNGPNFVEITYNPDFKGLKWNKYNKGTAERFAQIACAASFGSNIPINFTYKSDTVKFDFDNEIEFMKLVGVKYCSRNHEAFFFNDDANLGSLSKIGKTLKSADNDTLRTIINEPLCMYDYPYAQVFIYDAPKAGACWSFVNGNETPDHGIHVEGITNPILTFIRKELKKIGCRSINQALLLRHIILIVVTRVNKATYDKQGKGYLASYEKVKFKGKKMLFDEKGAPLTEITDKMPYPGFKPDFIKDWKAVEEIRKTFIEEVKEEKKVEKPTEKQQFLDDVEVEDATLAGTDRSHLCTLYVPEGKAAKDYPSAMIGNLNGGRAVGGIWCATGVPPNPSRFTDEKFFENRVIKSFVKTLGLRENVDYRIEENLKTARYGYICIMPDADVDGGHILGLFTYIIYTKFPTFILAGRLSYFETPIIRVERTISEPDIGLPEVENIACFFTNKEFSDWKKCHSTRGLTVRYLKGLGSSNDNDREDDAIRCRVIHIVQDPNARDSLHTVFHKTMITERKRWIAHYTVEEIVDQEVNLYRKQDEYKVPETYELNYLGKSTKGRNRYNDSIFIEKLRPVVYFREITNILDNNLIEFSKAAIIRAIPSMYDCLKLSHRQIMWQMLEYWNYGKKKGPCVKISQMCSTISAEVDYKHGETSLQMTLLKRLQRFTGGNNIALYRQDGTFGTRRFNGKDMGTSKSRYTFTKCEPWMGKLTSKILVHNVENVEEDGKKVETKFIPMYIPVTLINGATGISPGYFSYIPAHNPIDIINWYVERCNNEYGEIPLPWYRGFKGRNILVDGDLRIRDEISEAIQDTTIESESKDYDSDGGNIVNDDDFKDIDEDVCAKGFESEIAYKRLNEHLSKNVGQHVESYGIFNPIYNPDETIDVNITELPVGMCCNDYKLIMMEWMKSGLIKHFEDTGEEEADRSLTPKEALRKSRERELEKDKDREKSKKKGKGKKDKGKDKENKSSDIVNIFIYNVDTSKIPLDHIGLKLRTHINMSNMNLLDKNDIPMHFNNVGEIMNVHYLVMRKEIGKYKKTLLDNILEKIKKHEYTIILVRLVHTKVLGNKGQKREEWKRIMRENDIPEKFIAPLLQIPIAVLTDTNIDEIYDDIKKLKKEYDEINSRSVEDMYKEKLISLKEVFDVYGLTNDNKCRIKNTVED